MSNTLLVFFASFASIAVKAFQQRNVAFLHYRWVTPASFVLAGMDVFVISSIAVAGASWSLLVAMGSGGSLGCLASMYLHQRYIGRQHD